MASPFAMFRRNQRVLLAVVSVAAMIAFVFLDPVIKILSGTQGPQNPVVVRTNYGNYRRADLIAIREQRRWVGIFLERVVRARVLKETEGKGVRPEQINTYARNLSEYLSQQLMGRATPPGDEAAIETIVLAHRAEEMGMVASDRAVNDLLRVYAGSAYGQLRDIIAALKPDGRIPMSQTYLFEGLRRELLASRYAQMFRLATLGMPPAERWEYFEQLNLKAEAWVLPVKAEQFLKDVAQPTDDELQKFFERYQNRLPEPYSPEPGFKEPQKIAFQFFQANLEKLTEKMSGQVTSEEMHDYYEKNKAVQFRELALPPAKEETPAAKPGENEDPLGPDEPATDKPATEKTDGDKPATEKPGEPASGDKPAAEKSPTGKNAAPPKSSGVEPAGGRSPFRLVSNEQAAPAGAKPGDAPAAAGKAPADKSADAPADGKPAADAPAESKPAAESTCGRAGTAPISRPPARRRPNRPTLRKSPSRSTSRTKRSKTRFAPSWPAKRLKRNWTRHSRSYRPGCGPTPAPAALTSPTKKTIPSCRSRPRSTLPRLRRNSTSSGARRRCCRPSTCGRRPSWANRRPSRLTPAAISTGRFRLPSWPISIRNCSGPR